MVPRGNHIIYLNKLLTVYLDVKIIAINKSYSLSLKKAKNQDSQYLLNHTTSNTRGHEATLDLEAHKNLLGKVPVFF